MVAAGLVFAPGSLVPSASEVTLTRAFVRLHGLRGRAVLYAVPSPSTFEARLLAAVAFLEARWHDSARTAVPVGPIDRGIDVGCPPAAGAAAP